MIPKGIIIILFSTYFLTIGVVFIVFFTKRWVSASPDVSHHLIRATWIICVTITIVFGGLATGVITLLILKSVGFF